MNGAFIQGLRRILAALIAAAALLTGVPHAAAAGSYYTYAGYTFAVVGREAIISEYDGPERDLYIPQSIFGYTVTGIENNAFFGRDDFVSLNLNDAGQLRAIGSYAFYQCSGFRSAVLPGQLESLGTAAFMNCSGIETIFLGSLLTAIPDRAFCNCSSLTRVGLPSSVTSLGDYCFSGCTALTVIEIPDSVNEISDTAFFGCDSAVIYCSADSFARGYAEDHGISYVLTDENAYLLGDADGDGNISIVDATVIQRVLAGVDVPDPETAARNGDVDNNGLDVVDATMIRRHQADMYIPCPVGIWVTANE